MMMEAKVVFLYRDAIIRHLVLSVVFALAANAVWIEVDCTSKGVAGQPSDSSNTTAADSVADGAAREEPKAIPSAEKLITDSLGMKLALIPAGEFMMGSKETKEELARAFGCEKEDYVFLDEYSRHKVRITKAFYLGIYPVTVAQFRKFVVDTGYLTEAEQGIPRNESGGGGWGWGWGENGGHGTHVNWRTPSLPQTEEHPVVQVSWNDAMAFCRWLSGKEGKTYRLPTEAEWEYACRAGTETRYCFGDDPEKLPAFGNVADRTLAEKYPSWKPGWGVLASGKVIAGKDGYALSAPVGQFKPNAWGLYDMHGNVWQWCADRYGWDYYRQSPVDDPPGPLTKDYWRVVRGGCFDATAVNARSAARKSTPWFLPCYNTGFRVVRDR